MHFEERLRQLELRVTREHHHFREALAATRGVMEKAFNEMRLAFLEQAALERAHSQQAEQAHAELSDLVAQERAGQEAVLQDHEARLRRLEELLRPPAA
ncbi:MAG: hypothetical protein AB1758_33725 [Candidatus Eremiobacterota bacterium]